MARLTNWYSIFMGHLGPLNHRRMSWCLLMAVLHCLGCCALPTCSRRIHGAHGECAMRTIGSTKIGGRSHPRTNLLLLMCLVLCLLVTRLLNKAVEESTWLSCKRLCVR